MGVPAKSKATLDYPLRNMISFAVLLLTAMWACESYRLLTDLEYVPETDAQWFVVLFKILYLLFVYKANAEGCYESYMIMIGSLFIMALRGNELQDDWLERFQDQEWPGMTSMLLGRFTTITWWVMIVYCFKQTYSILMGKQSQTEDSNEICMA